MYRHFCLLCLLFLISLPATAQSSPELILDATIGSPLQGQMTWLDDERLLVGTSANVFLYTPSSSNEPLYSIPVGGNYFLLDDEIIAGGQRWDVATGELSGTTSIVKTWADDAARWRVNLLDDGRVEIIGETTQELPLPDGYDFSRIVFSPDGVNAAIVFRQPQFPHFYNEIAQLWNLSRFEKIADLPNSAGLEIVAEPQFYREGQRLLINYSTFAVYGSIFAETVIWDTTTGQRLNEPNAGYMNVRVSPDRQFAILADMFELEVWGMTQLGFMGQVDSCEACTSDYTSIAFSADGQRLVAAQIDGFTVWDVSQLKDSILPTQPLMRVTKENSIYDYQLNILFSPDSQTILRWGGSIGLEVWDISSEEQIAHLPIDGWILELSFSNDGRWLRFLSVGKWYIIDTENWQENLQFPYSGVLNSRWTQSAYWQDGNLIVDAVDGKSSQSIAVIADYRGKVLGMNTIQEWVLFQAENQLYSLRDNRLIFTFPENETITLSPNNPYFLMQRQENETTYSASLVLEDDGIHELAHLQSPAYSFNRPIISANAQTVSNLGTACGDGGGGRLTIWHGHAADSEIPGFVVGGYSCGPYAHLFSPDGKMLIVGWDSALIGFDVSQSEIMLDERNNAIPNVIYWYQFQSMNIRNLSLTISPDSQYLASSSDGCVYDPEAEGCVSIIRTEILSINTSPATPEEFAQLLFSIPDASSAIFSPDSQYILTNLGLWSIDGTEIMSLPNQIAAFDPNGRWLVTYNDNELLLWDWEMVKTGSTETLAQVPANGVTRLAFNADGSFLYAQRAGDVLRLRIQVQSN